MFESIVSAVNDIVWSPLLVVLLIFAGIYFSIRTRFVQVRRLRLMVKSLFAERPEKDGDRKGISSFEAFCIALSGRVGTGNIVGVATAIALGGPGAVFWMWLIAFFGASTAFMESTLAQMFKFTHETGYRGGPATYIEKGLGQRWLGIVFAVFTVIGYGILLTCVQSNGVSTAMANAYGAAPAASGIVLAIILGLVVIGGIRSIARVASVVTPFMAFGYIILALVIVGLNWQQIPSVFADIINGAFGIKPVAGGILGSTIMMGVKRGIFSNEAGQGGGAIVSASAEVTHPVRQGLAQSFSVYVDTLLVCSATAFMILCTGKYNILDAKSGEILVANAPELADNYVNFTQSAVNTVLTGLGSQFVSVALAFFAFTTIMAYYFYSESSIIHIFNIIKSKDGRKEKAAIWTFRGLIIAAVIFGAVKEANVVWQLGDIGVGLTAWINVIALLILCPKAIKALKEFETSLRDTGKEPDWKEPEL